jgi:5,10-methylenetetrahydromethanopterin reductase
MQVSAHDARHIPREAVEPLSFTGTAATLCGKIDELAARGIDEIVFQPAGPDIPRELEAFARLSPAVTTNN